MTFLTPLDGAKSISSGAKNDGEVFGLTRGGDRNKGDADGGGGGGGVG